jgi:hypothetical protein
LDTIVRAWLELAGQGLVTDPQAEHLQAWAASGCGPGRLLADPALVPEPFRSEPAVRRALIGSEV